MLTAIHPSVKGHIEIILQIKKKERKERKKNHYSDRSEPESTGSIQTTSRQIITYDC